MKYLKRYENFTPKNLNRDVNAPIEYKQVKYWLTYTTIFGDTEEPEDADERGLHTEPVLGSIEDLLRLCKIYGINKDFQTENTDYKTGDVTIYELHIKTPEDEEISKELKNYIKSKI
jgi:hypothetical protein